MEPLSVNKAIILSDNGNIIDEMCYKDVYKFAQLITTFISSYVIEKNQCLGLKMTHNIYVPSLVLSLQELEHTFIFLPNDETESQSIIQDLGLIWTLSLTPNNKNQAPLLGLNGQNLILERHPSSNKVNAYKNIFYVIRTSGSTGQSKFVKVTKESIESNINSLSRIFEINSSDVIYFGTPLTFDPSMIELLLALKNRACLLITPPKNQINPSRLYQTICHPKNGATILQIVPSLFLRWSDQQIENILNSNLKILAFGGERFPSVILNYKRCSNVRIFNLYGITEVSCWATIFEVPKEQISEVPLGGVLDDTIIQIRDDFGGIVYNGEGEIYIGSQKRICYVNNETILSLEKPVFRATGDVGIVSNKVFFYKERKNDVFKRFGHKIHLSKIEEMVQGETGLQNVCVWSKVKSKLLLFLIIETFNKGTKDKMLDKVRIKLLHFLPKQYFPDYFDIVRKCPVTSHGKIDRKTLESVYLHRQSTDKRPVIDIFNSLICKYFGLNQGQLSHLEKLTFFEIGGNSILAVQFLNEFEDELGVKCPDLVAPLFENDLSTCAEAIKNTKTSQKNTPSVQIDQSLPLKKMKDDFELKISWSYNFEACVDSTPHVFSHRGKTVVAVGSFSHIFVVLDTTDGAELAKFVLPDVIESTSTLSPCQNFLFVACFDGNMYCLDFANKKIKWAYQTQDRIKCRPILCRQDSAIVFGSYDKHVHCTNISDGSSVWIVPVTESIISTPLRVEEKIFIATICGTCLCLSEDGHILWSYKSGSPIFGAPCIHRGCILWPNVHGSVVSLTTDGQKKWQYGVGGHLYSSLISHKEFVLFGCHDHSLYILEEVDESPKAKVIVLGDVLTTPCILEDRLVVAGNSGRVFVIEFDGSLMGELELPGHVFAAVVGCGKRLFVGCRDNNLYCIEVK